MDRLPGFRIPVADRLFRTSLLEVREELREGLGDGRPMAVLFIPAAIGTEHDMDFAISLRRQMEPAMACR